ncbi:MAG: hypothetical protein FJX75_28895 [Armatimonadetes bacterium]|nr:hypothetical protein [Armatimonadota bacterium]
MNTPQGLGVWITYAPGSADAVVQKGQAHGVSHLWVKIADGTQDHASGSASYHPWVRSLVPAATAAGITVWSWGFIYDNPDAGRMQVAWSKDLGCAGHCFDVEVEGQDGSAPYANNSARARQMMSGARAEAGSDFWLGLTSYYNTRYHASTPWQALLEKCDGHCPQVYNAGNVERCLRWCYEDLQKPGWPTIYPLWGSISGALTGAHVRQFSQVTKEHGATSCSVWEWPEITEGAWGALAEVSSHWTAAPAPAPQGELKVVLVDEPGVPGRVVDCRPIVEHGVTRVDLRPLLEACGYPITDPNGVTQTPNGPRIYGNKQT